MKVRATQLGYYKVLRYPGDVFEVPDNLFSKRWMEPVPEAKADAAKPAKAKAEKAEKKEQEGGGV